MWWNRLSIFVFALCPGKELQKRQKMRMTWKDHEHQLLPKCMQSHCLASICEVGAGTAGSVLAARLAEKECVTVLLLEAGKSPPKVTDIPTAARNFIQSDIDWNYNTAPQKLTGAGLVNRSVAWPSGKTVGGCSVINAMLNLRGNKKNYDDWAAGGASGWSYDEVLPYFKKLEDNTDEEYVKNGYHGTGGPVTVSKPQYDPELKAAVLEAAEEKGYHIGDINGPDAT
ncbi:glucose dehydrogenase, partial [Trichonephila clavata]